jgi:hypothetical protein
VVRAVDLSRAESYMLWAKHGTQNILFVLIVRGHLMGDVTMRKRDWHTVKSTSICCMGSGAITVTGLLVEKVQIITH